MKVKLRNVYNFDLTLGGAAAGTSNAMSINSPFDPYIAAGGGSCSGFAEWAAMYHRYICYGSKHVVTFQVDSNGAADAVAGVFALSSQDTAPPVYKYADVLTEMKGARWRMMGNASAGATTNPRFMITKYCSVRTIEGQRHLDEDQYGADVTSDPSRQPQLVVAMGAYAAFSASVHVVVVSTYYTKFYRPKLATLAT